MPQPPAPLSVPPPGTPPAEVAIDPALVAGLLADQHPDLAALPLRAVDAGWDNAIFRLGDELAVRLPRRTAAADLIAHEQRWLPGLAPRLPLPAPAPLRAGGPGRGYPWRWSVLRWLDGEAADLSPPGDDQATVFAGFLRALHRPAPAEAPHNPFRGGSLREREAAFAVRAQRLAATTGWITPALPRLWEAALAAPIDCPPTWLHGDLHPRNVLVERGRLTGIIDWGDLTAGDPATDLAAIWMLFETPAARGAALDAYGPPSAATILRAKGWALHFGLIFLDNGLVDNPRFLAIGERTVRRLVETV